ncbi:hypothetical protein LJR034_004062 [Caballeronia sp. LjRoot34]
MRHGLSSHANGFRHRFALPRRFFDGGVKRYGFHDLSYWFLAESLVHKFPEIANRNVIAAHLGSGASLCAMSAGTSRDTSIGFSTLDGIPMATRCGALDAGVVLYPLRQQGLSAAEIDKILYEQSGLLGISGLSADSRELSVSNRPEAREALELFAFRIAGDAARLATTLGGLDCAGIGEHQPDVPATICERLAWLGVEIDHRANADNASAINSDRSRIDVLVLETDEGQITANEANSNLRSEGVAV